MCTLVLDSRGNKNARKQQISSSSATTEDSGINRMNSKVRKAQKTVGVNILVS